MVSSEQKIEPVPDNCVVIGGTGFVGRRLVEMLVERGAKRVVSFDIVPPPEDSVKSDRIQYEIGDIRDAKKVAQVCEGAECVWHIAACVGPYHPKQLYFDLNYQGTLNVLEACRRNKINKLVMSSSPSTRFDGKDVDGLTEAQMPTLPQASYLADYAETKAMGEMAVTKACCDELMTVAIAPHQVYGPRDNLFLPNFLEAAGSGNLRIFGEGKNRICFSHVDNYCHGLIIGERALYKGSPALGNFYIVTDGDTHPFKEGYANYWDSLNQACVGMGFADMHKKFHLPTWFMFLIAHICDAIGWVTGKRLKLNPFAVKMVTMHRWFKIDAAERDLKYKPIIPFKKGWADTIVWFRENWLPTYSGKGSMTGNIFSGTQRKIDIQNKKGE